MNGDGGPVAETAAKPAAAKLQVPLHRTTPRRQKPAATHVLAECVSVVGGTRRHRWLLIFQCPCCGSRHVAHGRGDLPPVLERPAACKRGRLAIHPIAAAVAA